MIKDELKNICAAMMQYVQDTFQSIAQIVDHKLTIENEHRTPWQLVGFEPETAAQLDNVIYPFGVVDSSNSKQKEHEEMQRIKTIKNARIRKDGRYEWRKMINGKRHYIVASDWQQFTQKISQYKKILKSHQVPKPHLSLYQLAVNYYEIIIQGQVKSKEIKPASADKYKNALRYLVGLKKNITTYTKEDIVKFLTNIKYYRTGAYCYHFLSRVLLMKPKKAR